MQLLSRTSLQNILFIDIETVSQASTFEELPDETQSLWEHKASFLKKEETDTPASLYSRAAIYAEFGKVVCISAGFIQESNGEYSFRLKSFYGHDEKKVLQGFKQLLDQHFNSPRHLLCAHNGKEFDFPYLARRMLIHGIKLPAMLDIAGKKPWEVAHLDTMELWKFGDYKSFTSLRLMTHIFDVPTPKDDISGAYVGRVYYEENDLERIARYCEKDTLAVAQLILRFSGRPLIAPEAVILA